MRTRSFLLCLFWGMASSFHAATFVGAFDEQAYQNYIEEHLDLARKISAETGIPVSICLAQALHESAAGSSTLAVEANNHFGIKALDPKKWPGERFFIEDDDFDETGNLKKSPFRKYESVEECYRDYGKFLRGNTRYAGLFKIPATDFEAWAKGLMEAGYATDSLYADHIIEKIERYQLNRFDENPVLKIEPRKKQKTDNQKVEEGKPARKTKPPITDRTKAKQSEGKDLQEKTRTPNAPFQPKEVDIMVAAPACPEPSQRLVPLAAKPVFLPITLKL